MNIYNQVNLECATLVARRYSTSFSLGIRMFQQPLRQPICAIYSFARYADEIVDTLHQYNKEELLDRFEHDTYQAIQEGISLNPILDAFQQIVNKYHIEQEHIQAFFASMRMDLDKSLYDQASFEEYIYGSAEVIGLMCLKVFCNGNQDEYQELESYAKALGSAFQKINFLRDIKSDYDDRGRIYFPNIKHEKISHTEKQRIEEDIKYDFDQAVIGIKKLPYGCRLGVWLSYVYYTKLFKKIKNKTVSDVYSSRIRISNGRKITLLLTVYFKWLLKLEKNLVL